MRLISILAVAVVSAAVATPAILAQCSGGSCPAPSSFGRGYSFAPQVTMPQSFAAFQPQAIPEHVIIDSPAIYEQTDASGQVWQHRDETYLKAWVAGRDAGFKAQAKTKTPGECACVECKCAEKVSAWKPASTPVVSTAEPIDEKPPTAHIEPDYESIPPLVPAFKPANPPSRNYRHAG